MSADETRRRFTFAGHKRPLTSTSQKIFLRAIVTFERVPKRVARSSRDQPQKYDENWILLRTRINAG